MKNRDLVLVVLVLFLGSSPSCTFLKDKLSKNSGVKPPNVIVFDPKAPLVSPGAEVVSRLAKLDPNLAVFASDIEAVERKVMKRTMDEGPGQDKKEKKTDEKIPFIPMKGSPNVAPFVPAKYEPPVGALMFQGEPVSGAGRAQAASLIGGMINGLKEIFSESHKNAETTGAVKANKTDTNGDTTTTMSGELSFNDDGSSAFGLGLKTESMKNGAKLVSEMTGRVDGLDCPNAEGQVPLTVKLRLGGESGGVGYTQDLTAFIRATVDDNADLTAVTIDLEQGTREVNKGNDFYVETAWTVQLSYAGGESQNYNESNWRVNRYSQKATPDAARASAETGQQSALSLALTVLAMAEQKWQNGGCVRIDAKSPGNVGVNSTTQIPVKVIHKFGGAEVASKLEATLAGAASVDPKLIPRTAGILTYVAPGETGKKATIKLNASSRRGRATLDLTASTGGQSYRVTGESNGVSFTGEICDLNKPFTIDAKFPGGNAKTSFAPSSAAGGSTTVSGGGGGGCVHTGGGNYTVTTKEDGTATLSWTTTDKIACGAFANSRTATFTLPLQPAPEISCP